MNEDTHRRKKIVRLLHQSLKGQLGEKEREALDAWVLENAKHQLLFEEITDTKNLLEELRSCNRFDWKEGLQKLQEKGVPIIASDEPHRRVHWMRFMSAAAAVLIIVLISFFLIEKNNKKPEVKKAVTAQKQNDALPGKFKAKLTLDDGTVVILDSSNNGLLAQQGKTNLVKKDGQLVYEGSSPIGGSQKGAENEVLYNTLTTAKGEMFATVLSDGTKVWLNSESSIRYPVTFKGDSRKVEITGEAYFEVAPYAALNSKARLPFIVKAPGIEVEVLGTHFNVNSYEDEGSIKTTLLEGKVKLRSTRGNTQTVLSPGHQALLNKADQHISVTSDLDVDAEVAWHLGLFQFNNADLKEVMRQLARWYDVEVEYRGNINEGDFEFIGKLPRNMNLSQVLGILQKQQVHFKIENKKIIVSP